MNVNNGNKRNKNYKKDSEEWREEKTSYVSISSYVSECTAEPKERIAELASEFVNVNEQNCAANCVSSARIARESHGVHSSRGASSSRAERRWLAPQISNTKTKTDINNMVLCIMIQIDLVEWDGNSYIPSPNNDC